jgi:very-short-patch-repair endonuclease
VLRQLLEDTGAIATVARRALELCHFDPDTGQDLEHSERSKERCEAACYDCLMSYYNQLDHGLLDRQLILELLLQLTHSMVKASPVSAGRPQHLAQLKVLCDSDLEKEWLDFLETHNLSLPDQAQKLVDGCQTRVDFFYSDHQVAIYIDGPVHNQADIAAKDAQLEECLTFNLGLTVIRFRYDADWLSICKQYAYIFG